MIQTHVITGFLGVGKTTTLQHLLRQKPAHEKWAVLLNEFGKTGLDAALLESDGVAVTQIPGGCLCCAAELPFQITLNKIIRFEKPQRLFIEPSGLGHPDKIIQLLKQDQYKDILSLQPVLTLIDMRHLSIDKYRRHDIYQRQLSVADVFIANKSELASNESVADFEMLLQQYQRPGFKVEAGKLSTGMWQGTSVKDVKNQTVKGDVRFIVKLPKDEVNDFFTETVVLDENSFWPKTALISYLESLALLRVKGIVAIKENRFILINGVDENIEVKEVTTNNERCRLEIISAEKIELNKISKKINQLKLLS